MTPPKKPSPGLDGLLSAATAAASKVSYAAPASYFQYDLVDAPPGTSRLVTLRAEVQASIDDPAPNVPHDKVMGDMRALLAERKARKNAAR